VPHNTTQGRELERIQGILGGKEAPSSIEALAAITLGGCTVKVKVKVTLHAMKAYWESGGMAPPILDLGARWR
jgi:hypothetical protein